MEVNAELISYFIGAFLIGWSFGYTILIFHKFVEKI